MNCPCTKSIAVESHHVDLVCDHEYYELRATVDVEFSVESCEHGDSVHNLRVTDVLSQWVFFQALDDEFGAPIVSPKVVWIVKDYENGSHHEREWRSWWQHVLDREGGQRERIEDCLVTRFQRSGE